VSEMLGEMGKSESQSTLADSSNLDTTTAGTNWGSYVSDNPVARVLDKFQTINYYIPNSVDSVTSSIIRNYEDVMIYDLNIGAPVAADVVLNDTSPLLANEPTPGTDGQEKVVYHWFDIRGYSSSGTTTDYEDSTWASYGSESATDAVIQISGRGYVY
jgi:hypothetical protein